MVIVRKRMLTCNVLHINHRLLMRIMDNRSKLIRVRNLLISIILMNHRTFIAFSAMNGLKSCMDTNRIVIYIKIVTIVNTETIFIVWEVVLMGLVVLMVLRDSRCDTRIKKQIKIR